MKKVLLPVFAVLLAASAANAQVKINKQIVTIGQTASEMAVAKQLTLGNMQKSVKKAAPARIAENQKYVAMDGVEEPYTAIGLPGYSPTDFAQLIPSSYYSAYVGCKVVGMRWLTFTASKMTPALMTLSGNSLTPVAQGSEISTKASPLNADRTAFEQNWNEVMFEKPYTIEAGTDGLFASFAYTQSQKKAGSNYDNECYPFLVAQNSDENAAIYANGNFGQAGNGWTGVDNRYCMCVQLIVEKEGGFVDDLSMGSIAANLMLKPSESLSFQFAVRNLGSKTISDYEFGVLLDNKEIGQIKSDGKVGIGTSDVALDGSIDLSKYNLTFGAHTIGVKVNSVNGEAPAGNLNDDQTVAQFRVYNETTKRQYNLLEHFTSWTCGYCPYGYETIRALQKQRDDVAWVAIHQDQNADSPDPLTVADGAYITQFSTTGFPSANLNRFNLGGSTIAGVVSFQNATQGAQSLSQVLDQEDQLAPSQVKLNMTTNLTLPKDQANQPAKLTVTVNGQGVKNASKVLESSVLGLYITENGLTGRQYGNQSSRDYWYQTYDHENSLRVVGTENPWGDEIVWNGDNFEKTYEIEVPAGSYDYTSGKTLNAVAFVSLPYVVTGEGGKLYYNDDINNVWVNQCILINNVAEGTTTGVKAINGADANATVVARYAADGTQISAPQKGLNILKMSDGTTRKVIVNK